MLNFTRKTPSKLDDFFILLVGVALIAVPIARISGALEVRFEVMEVIFGAVLPILVVFGKWVYFVYTYLSEQEGARIPMPDTITAMVIAMALFHLLPMWKVDLATWNAMFAENTLVTNLWLVVMTYFLAAAVLGRYAWPWEFVVLIFGIGSKVADMRKGGVPLPEDVEGELAELIVERQVVDTPIPVSPVTQPNLYARPVATGIAAAHEPARNVPFGGQTPPGITALMPQVRVEMTAEQLVEGGMEGDPVIATRIVEKLNGLDRRNMESQMLAGNIYPNVIAKVFTAIDNHDAARLIEVMQHPAFSRQKQIFVTLLSE